MKYLIISDIHGGSEELREALGAYERERCDALILLGDLLNHGPRNQIPGSYRPPEVAEILNLRSHEILAVRGNCDSEVDSMMFDFPCDASSATLFFRDGPRLFRIFLTHGHLHDFSSGEGARHLGLREGDLVLSGHTHVAGIFRCPNGVINVNPGSITLPKGGTAPSYAILSERGIRLHALGGSAYDFCEW
ncbi:MAG: phosphodiesterase [Succinivibrionaceae bacterium]|nr:phosphodiesterase [Succinivibrionaceae bacterium]